MVTVGSLFAGIGGICSAFKQAGCNIAWANEQDKHACRTYRANSDAELIEDDVSNVNPSDLGYVDIITSGFPCQAFSVAGYRKGFNDSRGNMFFETARFIDNIKPKAFLLENVKNIVGHDKGRTFEVIRNTIDDLGYSFIPFVLNSKDYGIPQTRDRAYMVGFKDESYRNNSGVGTFNFKIPAKIELTSTVRDFIDTDRKPDKYYYAKDHPYYSVLSKTMTKLDTVYQWRRTYVRENKSKLCPTLTANMGTGGHNVPLIIDDWGIRKLTTAECLGFQGFSSDFAFPSDMADSNCYKQAGNSVVVPVVKLIAESIIHALK